MTGKQRTETRTEGTITPRGSRTTGAQRKPRKRYANAPDGRRWSNPAKSTEADAGHANGAKRISSKNLYTSREASAICSQRKNGRTPTPDGNGRRTWKRGGEYDSEPPPLVRAIRSASASAQIGADSGAAGGRLGNGGGVQMRFRMFSKPRFVQSKDARKPRARKRNLWRGGLVCMQMAVVLVWALIPTWNSVSNFFCAMWCVSVYFCVYKGRE